MGCHSGKLGFRGSWRPGCQKGSSWNGSDFCTSPSPHLCSAPVHGTWIMWYLADQPTRTFYTAVLNSVFHRAIYIYLCLSGPYQKRFVVGIATLGTQEWLHWRLRGSGCPTGCRSCDGKHFWVAVFISFCGGFTQSPSGVKMEFKSFVRAV